MGVKRLTGSPAAIILSITKIVNYQNCQLPKLSITKIVNYQNCQLPWGVHWNYITLKRTLKKCHLINSITMSKTKRKYIVEVISTKVDFSTAIGPKLVKESYMLENNFLKQQVMNILATSHSDSSIPKSKSTRKICFN